ncbi:unnamed protein product [Gongylonema pulchrum]|uniref:CW-type domain-containing protein n=1 Tax=Gongylonema pulchrum TaxID=637853 RepID=A0A183DGF1_9BILA|nr:unnamed protein product [Gongylonema pulchrum]
MLKLVNEDEKLWSPTAAAATAPATASTSDVELVAVKKIAAEDSENEKDDIDMDELPVENPRKKGHESATNEALQSEQSKLQAAEIVSSEKTLSLPLEVKPVSQVDCIQTYRNVRGMCNPPLTAQLYRACKSWYRLCPDYHELSFSAETAVQSTG